MIKIDKEAFPFIILVFSTVRGENGVKYVLWVVYVYRTVVVREDGRA
jgi:hypothetical protein